MLGRGGEGSELFACDPAVSQRHAVVRCGPDGFCVVEDIGSADGTFVNGVRIDSPTQLRPGDELRVGGTRLRVTSVTPGRASVIVPGAESAVNGPSSVPHDPPPSLDVPGILRADAVQLWRTIRGVHFIDKSEKGWLILTVTGEVRFYKRLPADMTATPDLSAPSTTEFAHGIGDTGIRAHFGEQKRNVVFTGAKPRALSAEKMEEIARMEESVANAGDSLGNQSLSLGGDAASLAIYILLVIKALRDRKRKLAAMRAWYPVLLGERSWPTIDAIEAEPLMNFVRRAERQQQQRDQHDLAEAANQLAVAVGAQWEAEAAMRSLNDPNPLRVRWVAADTSLADDWDVLVRLAGSSAGWPSPPPPGTWATGPDELAGSGNHLVKVLAQVPTGRLVVLGEPGAGKTMLTVRLVLDLLASRTGGAPVPVLVSLASWNPSERDLHGWLADQLAIDHPALAAQPVLMAGTGRPDRIATLLAAGLILPILDGLDEIPEEVRRPAITQINDSLRPGEQLIMTCRTGTYRDAVRPPVGAEITLRAAAVIQLCPLDAADVSRYLRDDAGGMGASARWDPVLATLGTQAPAGRTLVTPLMVGLARTIYNPRPGERTAELRDPAELCRLHDQAAVEAHLFDAFITAAYRYRPDSRWDPRQAETWLVLLARHLETTIGNPDLAWWQLLKAGPSAGLKLAAGLAAALVTGLTAGLGAGLAAGLLFGFGGAAGAVVVAARRKNPRPSQAAGKHVAAVYAAAYIPTVAAVFAIWLAFGFLFAAATAFLFGYVVDFKILPRTLVRGLGDLDKAASPRRVLARDRRAAFDTVVVSGFLFMLLFGIIAGIIVGVLVGLVPGFVFGFAFPIYLGLYFGQTDTAWTSYVLVRGWLALHRRLPWSLMDFLVDAHGRGVLRQAGSVYQFRHIELQHRLATRPRPPASGS